MEMQPMQARFATQEQAESVMRKLAALRSDCFRLERVGTNTSADADADAGSPIMNASPSVDSFTASVIAGATFQSISNNMTSGDAAAHQYGESPEVGLTTEFTLSANVPDGSSEQARNVIIQAGGQVI